VYFTLGGRRRRRPVAAHQAVAQAKQYIAQGYGWVTDLDLEKFFDRVNHDKLMGQVAKRVEDKRLLKLIRALLNAGVMENGLVSPSVEGTPQGGPLSPLLSNLVLNELDQELERRGHRPAFVDPFIGVQSADLSRLLRHSRSRTPPPCPSG
jgi:RNA-directed DNA polymerase